MCKLKVFFKNRGPVELVGEQDVIVAMRDSLSSALRTGSTTVENLDFVNPTEVTKYQYIVG